MFHKSHLWALGKQIRLICRLRKTYEYDGPVMRWQRVWGRATLFGPSRLPFPAVGNFPTQDEMSRLAIPDHVVDLHVWRTFSHKSPTTEACQTYFEAGRNFVFRKKGFHIHLAFVLKAPACLHRVGDRGVQALNILRFYVSVKFRDSLSPFSLFDWLASNGGVTMLSSASRLCLHADMEIISENLFGDVADNLTDRLLSSPAFG